jgi:hypothetical protein
VCVALTQQEVLHAPSPVSGPQPQGGQLLCTGSYEPIERARCLLVERNVGVPARSSTGAEDESPTVPHSALSESPHGHHRGALEMRTNTATKPLRISTLTSVLFESNHGLRRASRGQAAQGDRDRSAPDRAPRSPSSPPAVSTTSHWRMRTQPRGLIRRPGEADRSISPLQRDFFVFRTPGGSPEARRRPFLCRGPALDRRRGHPLARRLRVLRAAASGSWPADRRGSLFSLCVCG